MIIVVVSNSITKMTAISTSLVELMFIFKQQEIKVFQGSFLHITIFNKHKLGNNER